MAHWRRTARASARRLDQMREDAETGLNLGCGSSRIDGLINADAFDPSVRDIELDALDLSAYPDGSVDLIENHHMFEHLTFAEGEQALAEWRRALKSGGHLVMTMPDLDGVVRRWARSDEEQRYGPCDRSTVAAMIYGSQEHPGMFHRSGYNAPRIERLLQRVGFSEVEVVKPFPPNRSTPSMLVIATNG